jgi:hypothetical protein
VSGARSGVANPGLDRGCLRSSPFGVVLRDLAARLSRSVGACVQDPLMGQNGAVFGGDEVADSSLASIRQSVTTTNQDDSDIEADEAGGCPELTGWLIVSESTGQMFPVRCGRNRCAYCLRVNARKRALAIAYARPERAILLTQVGEDWQSIRDRMKVLRHRLSKSCGAFEWVWHVEPNPKETGHHVHAWQRGSYVPQALLSSAAASVGMGDFARINRIRSTRRAAGYGLKGLDYGLKGAEADDQGVGYLVDNGWRLTHQSRSYFVSVTGEKMGVKATEKLAAADSGRIRDEGPWVLMRAV